MINELLYRELHETVQESGATLVAVSKTKPAEAIDALYALGHRHFGENKVQELLEKKKELPSDIAWHFIGRLQKNKVNKIVGEVSLIHSVDSIELATKISNRAESLSVVQNILLQVNMAGEESKQGFSSGTINEAIATCRELAGIDIKGLMAIGNHAGDEAVIKQTFLRMKDLFQEQKQVVGDLFSELSMGMTSDYKLALECGSTMVRVGSLIFGKRDYTKEVVA